METRNTPTDPGQIPVIPLPNPGEGGPVGPNFTENGDTVVIQPLPGFVPTPQRTTNVRFLNAACGYPALRLYVGSSLIAGPLDAGSVSAYARLTSGRQSVTVTDSSGYIYLQTRLRFEAGERTTVIVLLRPGGLQLQTIQED